MATIFCDPSAGGANNGSSWTDARTSLQAAIDACGATDEVWVKSRTINLSAVIDLDNANLKLYGGFDNALTGTAGSIVGRDLVNNRTTLDGGGTYGPVCSVVRNCTVDGFILQHGGQYYGGFHVNYASASIVVKNVKFIDNQDDYRGAGMLITTATNVDIDDCEFTDNHGTLYAAGLCLVAGTVTIDNTTFTNNTVSYAGSAIHQIAGTMTLTGCTITGNTTTSGAYGEGGQCNHIGGTTNYSKCKILNGVNASNWGGGVRFESLTASKMINCVITGNNGGYGGGLLVSGCTTYFTNCIVANNSATDAGGGIRNRSGGTTYIYNSIFWGNTCATEPQISHAGTAITVQYSDISGGYTGTGNVNDDPHFITTGNDPFNFGTLTSGAIDSGNAGATNYPTTDILGQARVDYSTVSNTGAGSPAYSDMGAYELQEAAPPAVSAAPLLLLFN